jgi:uncharacterized delta-60 repeat protein
LVVAFGLALPSAAAARAGDLDPRFSVDGKQVFGNSGPADADVDEIGRTLVLDSFGDALKVVRLTRSGTRDRSFADRGTSRVDFGPEMHTGGALIPTTEGDYLVVGSALGMSGRLGVARLAGDGTLDPSFGTGGIVTHGFGQSVLVADAAATPAGGVLVTGRLHDGTRSSWLLARLRADGTLDPTFSDDGWTVLEPNAESAEGLSVAPDAFGRILVSGSVRFEPETRFAVVVGRVLHDGSPDPGFGRDSGRTSIPNVYADDDGGQLAPQADGGVVIAATGTPDPGRHNSDFALARLTAAGELDPDFGVGGLVHTDFGLGFDNPAEVTVDESGRIYVVGAVGRSEDFGIARYHPTGELDREFGGDGRVRTSFGSDTLYTSSVAVGSEFAPSRRLTVVGHLGTRQATGVARYLLRPDKRPGDRDADAIRDADDRCPDLYADRRPGCPRYRSTISIDYTGRKFRGRVRPEQYLCTEFPERHVRVYREAPGRDRLIGRTDQYGTFWDVNALNRRGRFYAVAERTLDSSYGICLRAESEMLAVGTGERTR